MSGFRGRGGKTYGGEGFQINGSVRITGTDRFCSGCGNKIKGFAIIMPTKCPFANCGKIFYFRYGPDGEQFNDAGLGRCNNCKTFMHKDDMYCQCCRYLNSVAKDKKQRLEQQAILKRKAQLENDTGEKEAKIARLEAHNLQPNAIVGQYKKQPQTQRPPNT